MTAREPTISRGLPTDHEFDRKTSTASRGFDMRTSARALLSVGLLAGFYVLAVAVVLGLLTADVFAIWATVQHPVLGRLMAALVAFSLVVGVTIGRGIAVAARSRSQPAGVPVSAAQEPALWATVEELATRLGTRPPDELRLIPAAQAAVTDDGRLLGLMSGTRRMYIGLPLLLTFTVDQLRAVLGHELGHYSGRHLWLGPAIHRGEVSLSRVVADLKPNSVLGRAFRGYAWMYFRISLAASRRTEVEADRSMVAIAGRRAAATSLRESQVVAAAWDFFLSDYVGPGVERQLQPDDLFAGFLTFIREPNRQAELDRIRQAPPSDDRSPYDSHPSTAERLSAIARQPESGTSADPRPAVELLAHSDAARRAVQDDLLAGDGVPRTALGWDEFVRRFASATASDRAGLLLEAAERLTGAEQATLDTVLGILELGQGRRLGEELRQPGARIDPEQRDSMALAAVSVALAELVACALVDVGRATWRLSWSDGPYRLVAHDGSDPGVDDAVRPAVTSPGAVAELRTWLRAAGVEPTFRVTVSRPAGGPKLLGALPDLARGPFRVVDALVYDTGMLLVPVPVWSGAWQRLASQTGVNLNVQRVERLMSTPYDELVAAPNTRQISVTAIADVRTRRSPFTSWRLDVRLVDGTRLALRPGLSLRRLRRQTDGLLARMLESRQPQPRAPQRHAVKGT